MSGHGLAAIPHSVRLHRGSSQPPTLLLPFSGVTRLRGTIGCSWFPRAQLGRTCPLVQNQSFGMLTLTQASLATVGSVLPQKNIPAHGELVEGCVRPRLSQSEQFRLQGGPSSVPFTCFPTSLLTRFDASLFCLLLRRFWLPLPLSSRFLLCSKCSNCTSSRLEAKSGAPLSTPTLDRKTRTPCETTSVSVPKTWTGPPLALTSNSMRLDRKFFVYSTAHDSTRGTIHLFLSLFSLLSHPSILCFCRKNFQNNFRPNNLIFPEFGGLLQSLSCFFAEILCKKKSG